MSLTANIDLREFNAALKQLASVSKRDFADVTNDNMADLCLTAARYPAKADRSSISGLRGKPWWPAFVRKVMNLSFVGPAAPTKKRRKGRAGGVRNAEAARVSAGLLKSRLARVGAMRAFLGAAAIRFDPRKYRKGGFGRKQYKGIVANKAQPSGVKAFAEAIWKFSNNHAPWSNSSASPKGRPSPSQDVNKKTHILAVALNRAVPVVTARLKHAINKKLERLAKTYSAHGRAITRGFA